jgi:hypothetical protein
MDWSISFFLDELQLLKMICISPFCFVLKLLDDCVHLSYAEAKYIVWIFLSNKAFIIEQKKTRVYPYPPKLLEYAVVVWDKIFIGPIFSPVKIVWHSLLPVPLHAPVWNSLLMIILLEYLGCA